MSKFSEILRAGFVFDALPGITTRLIAIGGFNINSYRGLDCGTYCNAIGSGGRCLKISRQSSGVNGGHSRRPRSAQLDDLVAWRLLDRCRQCRSDNIIGGGDVVLAQVAVAFRRSRPLVTQELADGGQRNAGGQCTAGV